MIYILIQCNIVSKNIFTLCFNLKKKIKCHITVIDKTKFIKNWNKDNFDYIDKVYSKIPTNINKFNIILSNVRYDYNDLFDKLKLSDINQLNYTSNDKLVYDDSKLNYNYKFITTHINLDTTLFTNIKIECPKVKIEEGVDGR